MRKILLTCYVKPRPDRARCGQGDTEEHAHRGEGAGEHCEANGRAQSRERSAGEESDGKETNATGGAWTTPTFQLDFAHRFPRRCRFLVADTVLTPANTP